MMHSEPEVTPQSPREPLPETAETSRPAGAAGSENKAVRDLRADLEDRAGWIQQRIAAQQAEFEMLVARLKAEQKNRIEGLKPQLQAVTALLRFATLHHDARMALTRAIALAATAEIAARKFSQAHSRDDEQGRDG